jgi:hypothetical protein
VCAGIPAPLLLTGARPDAHIDGMKSILRRDHARDVRVACLSGACWITWVGGGDVVLEPSQRIDIGRARGLVIETLRGGTVEIKERGRRVLAAAGPDPRLA